MNRLFVFSLALLKQCVTVACEECEHFFSSYYSQLFGLPPGLNLPASGSPEAYSSASPLAALPAAAAPRTVSGEIAC